MSAGADRAAEAKPQLHLVRERGDDEAGVGTGIGAALLRRIARGELGPTARLHRIGRILAFGRIDRLAAGYPEAVAAARASGFEPVERIAGGRAAVFHEGTLAFSKTTRESRAASGTHARFAELADVVAAALRAVGVDARVGEVPGEYCPGAYSVNARGAVKIAGIGQRLTAGGAHVGGVLVVRDGGLIRTALEPVYGALGLEWDPATAGSVADELGEEPAPRAGEDPLIGAVAAAIRDQLACRYQLIDTELDPETVRLATELGPDYLSPG